MLTVNGYVLGTKPIAEAQALGLSTVDPINGETFDCTGYHLGTLLTKKDPERGVVRVTGMAWRLPQLVVCPNTAPFSGPGILRMLPPDSGVVPVPDNLAHIRVPPKATFSDLPPPLSPAGDSAFDEPMEVKVSTGHNPDDSPTAHWLRMESKEAQQITPRTVIPRASHPTSSRGRPLRRSALLEFQERWGFVGVFEWDSDFSDSESESDMSDIDADYSPIDESDTDSEY